MNTNDTYLNLIDRAIGTLDRLPELPNPFLVDMSGGTPDDI